MHEATQAAIPHLPFPLTSAVKGNIIAFAKPRYSGGLVKELRRLIEQDNRLEVARVRLTQSTASDAFKEKSRAQAALIAAGQLSVDELQKVRTEAVAAELAQHRTALAEQQVAVRQKAVTPFKEVREVARTAVGSLRAEREASELQEATTLGIPFAPSTILSAIAATERWLNEQCRFDPSGVSFHDKLLSVSLGPFLKGET